MQPLKLLSRRVVSVVGNLCFTVLDLVLILLHEVRDELQLHAIIVLLYGGRASSMQARVAVDQVVEDLGRDGQ